VLLLFSVPLVITSGLGTHRGPGESNPRDKETLGQGQEVLGQELPLLLETARSTDPGHMHLANFLVASCGGRKKGGPEPLSRRSSRQ
jgi:hypothetical protein